LFQGEAAVVDREGTVKCVTKQRQCCWFTAGVDTWDRTTDHDNFSHSPPQTSTV